MTSKSPVRACDDIDETALSYAEIKALCAGDPRIKEKMDLDVDVQRLRLMKGDHQSKRYKLEDQIMRYYPQEIEKQKGFIAGFEQDQETLRKHPLPEKDFVGMEIEGKTFLDKEEAGQAILDACKKVSANKDLKLGNYRGFKMTLYYNPLTSAFMLQLKGAMSHPVELGTDARGNLTRIENALNSIPQRINNAQQKMETLIQQETTAKAEVDKPFPQEEELAIKSKRLAELDSILNLDDRTPIEQAVDEPEEDRPSALAQLKEPCQVGEKSTDYHSKNTER